MDVLSNLALLIRDSPLSSAATGLLGNVPGLPPIVQTVHLIGIATIMGSIVLIDLKVLGLALPSQTAEELARRLMPWMWRALPVMAASGLLFVFARPVRYFANPVFILKFSMLLPAIALALLLNRALTAEDGRWARTPVRRTTVKIAAAASLTCWIGVVLAGRWIAYADYLFPE